LALLLGACWHFNAETSNTLENVFIPKPVSPTTHLTNPAHAACEDGTARNITPSRPRSFYDGVADILFRRRPFSDYDHLVADWRKKRRGVPRRASTHIVER
jgi:hypothetical protein